MCRERRRWQLFGAARRFGPWGQTPSCMNQTQDKQSHPGAQGNTQSPPSFCHAHDAAPVHAGNPCFGVSKTLVSRTDRPIRHFPDSCTATDLPAICTGCQITSSMSCALLQWVVAQGKSNLPPSHGSRPRSRFCSWLQCFLLPRPL